MWPAAVGHGSLNVSVGLSPVFSRSGTIVDTVSSTIFGRSGWVVPAVIVVALVAFGQLRTSRRAA